MNTGAARQEGSLEPPGSGPPPLVVEVAMKRESQDEKGGHQQDEALFVEARHPPCDQEPRIEPAGPGPQRRAHQRPQGERDEQHPQCLCGRDQQIPDGTLRTEQARQQGEGDRRERFGTGAAHREIQEEGGRHSEAGGQQMPGERVRAEGPDPGPTKDEVHRPGTAELARVAREGPRQGHTPSPEDVMVLDDAELGPEGRAQEQPEEDPEDDDHQLALDSHRPRIRDTARPRGGQAQVRRHATYLPRPQGLAKLNASVISQQRGAWFGRSRAHHAPGPRQAAAVRPGEVLRQDTDALLSRRQGECNRCGACCKILFRCPFLGTDADGQYTCRIYEKRFAQCRLFPLHPGTCVRSRSAATPSSRTGAAGGPRRRVASPQPKSPAPRGQRACRTSSSRAPSGATRARGRSSTCSPTRSRSWPATTAATTPATPSSSADERFVAPSDPLGDPAPGHAVRAGQRRWWSTPAPSRRRWSELREARRRGRRQPRRLRPGARHPPAPRALETMAEEMRGQPEDRHHARGGSGPAYEDKAARVGACACATCCAPDGAAREARGGAPALRADLPRAPAGRPSWTGTTWSTTCAAFGERLRPRIADTSLVLHAQLATGTRVALRGGAGHAPGHRPRHLSVRDRPRSAAAAGACTGLRRAADAHRRRHRRRQGLHHPRGRRGRCPRRSAAAWRSEIREARRRVRRLHGRPRRCGWFDAVVVRYVGARERLRLPSPSPSWTSSTCWPRSRSAPAIASGARC